MASRFVNKQITLSTFKNWKLNYLKYLSTGKTNSFELIYDLEVVKFGCLINKLKLQASVLTIGLTPMSFALEKFQVLPDFVPSYVALTGCAVSVPLYVVGQLFYKLVGKIYVNAENTDEFKISYIGFFGNRIDIIRNISSIHTLGSDKPSNFYTTLKIENPKLHLKIHEKYLDYYNVEYCRKMFGESFQR